MLTRVLLAKNGAQYKALLLRLQHGRVRCDSHSCEELLALISGRPFHRVFACHDETLHLCTYVKQNGRAEQQLVLYLKSYGQPVEGNAARFPVMRQGGPPR